MKKTFRRSLACLLLLPVLLSAACQQTPEPAPAPPEEASVSAPEQPQPAAPDGTSSAEAEPEPEPLSPPEAEPPREEPKEAPPPDAPPEEEPPPEEISSGAEAPQTAQEDPCAEPCPEPEPPCEATDCQSPSGEEPAPETPPEEEPVQEPAPSCSKLYILMYHDVVEGDGSGCNDWTITTDRLREDLQWMTDQGFTFYLPRELAQGVPLAEQSVMITFDDGYASNYTLAFPLLKEFGAKAVISPIVRYVQEGVPGYLTWDMCREMAASGLVEFGSHTYDLHGADDQGIRRLEGECQADYEARVLPDLQTSIDLLSAELGQPVTFFAYPNGKTEPWAVQFLAEHFSVTVTTAHGPADLSGGLYSLPRHNVTVQNKASQWLS